MGTAGPSGFHSANTHAELLEKPGQTHKGSASLHSRRKEEQGEGVGSGNNEKVK